MSTQPAHAFSESTCPTCGGTGKLLKGLTLREEEILHFLTLGWKDREIAEALGIETRTVKAHLIRMFLKAGIVDSKRQKNKRTVLVLALCKDKPENRINIAMFTPRERQIAKLLSEGNTNRSISELAGISSVQLVKNYLRNIYDKVGCWSRLELALRLRGAFDEVVQ